MAHPKTTKPKKQDPIGVRFEKEEERAFLAACKANGLTPQDALRAAAAAMVVAHLRFGRIPRDMEIRQVQIGDVQDIKELLERVRMVAESQGDFVVGAPDLLSAELGDEGRRLEQQKQDGSSKPAPRKPPPTPP